MSPAASESAAVLRLITRLNVGGPARQALLLTRALADEFPTVLAAGRVGTDEGELSDPRVAVRSLPLVRPVNPIVDMRAIRKIRRLVRELGPAIVHTHMAKAGSTGRLAVASLRQRPRTVHTFHGHVLDGYFGRAAQRTFLEIERRLARRTDVLIAVSPEIRDALLDLGVGRADQFEVIPLGLDLSPYLSVEGRSGTLRSRLGLTEDVPLVGASGRLVPIKDLGTLLRSVAVLDGVHLALLGDGDDRRRLQALAAQLGIADRVHFTGFVTDLPADLSDLDLVALTSLNEGTPASLIEASAAGRPIVATDVGGVRAVVDHGVTGLVLPPSRPDLVADAIATMLEDREAAEAVGRAGRERVRHRFSHERLVRDIRLLYTRLVVREASRPT